MRSGIILGVVAVLCCGACGGTEDDPSRRPSGTAETVVPAACAGVTPDVTITMRGRRFDDDSMSLPPGGIVRWVNDDGDVHTVTSGRPGAGGSGEVFDSGDLTRGESFCFQFVTAGSHAYFCRHHPGTMQGTITVGQAHADDDGSSGD